MQKDISIITVVYNAENFIERTIKSVINQSYSSIEYLVIDGGSSDKTLEIINQYKDKIDVIISEADNGIYDAMNKGISQASGRWINFMNAGDTFIDNNTVDLIMKSINQEDDIFYGSRYIVDEETSETKLEIAESVEYISKKMPFGHQAAFAKTELLKKYKFNMAYRLSADYDFFLKCYLNNHTFKNIDIPVCYFYEGGLSMLKPISSFVETLKVLFDYFDESTVKQNIAYIDLLRLGNIKNRNTIKNQQYLIHCKDKQITSFYNDFSYKLARFITYPINKLKLMKSKRQL